MQVTWPRPLVVTRTGIATGPKTAVTDRAESSVTAHVARPEQGPRQPTKRDVPLSPAALSVTRLPPSQTVSQSVVHETPGTSLVTRP